MYPSSQSYKAYHDSASSDDASIHGEDEAFLTKELQSSPTPRKWYHPASILRNICCTLNASIISCVLSALTAGLVLFALFLLAGSTTTSSGLPQLQASLIPVRPVPPHHPAPKPAGNLQHMHCGSTPAEARALGCVFDIMSFAWTPPACYDRAISAETMQRTGPWIFYLDHEATQPIPFEELSNELIVWTEHSYHVSHCLYAWERIHRAYLGQRILPAEVAGLNHSLHCRDLLNDPKTTDKKIVNAIAYMVFDSCIDLNA